jgi:hypothetical protein
MRSACVRLCLIVALGTAATFAVPSVQAGSLPPPTGEIILTVDGAITNTTDGKQAQFDLATLEAMGLTVVETSTPWTDGVVRYEGVLARDLMKQVGATGSKLLATALNDYLAEIPLSDLTDYNVILAIKANGEYLPVRDKGPIFVVYPLDSDPGLLNNTIYSRCIWQLTRLTVQ